MFKRLFMALFALALVLAACGDGDSDSGTSGDSGGDSGGELNADEASALSAIEELSSDGEGPFDELSEGELKCAARAIVDDDSLFEAMMDDADFDTMPVDQQLDAVNIFVDCAPDTLAQVMADGMAEGSGLDAEQASCLGNEIVKDRNLMSEFLATGAAGGEPSASVIGAVFDLMDACDISLADLSG